MLSVYLTGENQSRIRSYFMRILYSHQWNFHEASVFKLWFTFLLVFCQRKGGITKSHLPRLPASVSRLYQTYKTMLINVPFALFDESQRDVRSQQHRFSPYAEYDISMTMAHWIKINWNIFAALYNKKCSNKSDLVLIPRKRDKALHMVEVQTNLHSFSLK